MKLYVTPKGITLSGKAWEIRETLKHYKKTYTTVKEWQQAATSHLKRPSQADLIPIELLQQRHKKKRDHP